MGSYETLPFAPPLAEDFTENRTDLGMWRPGRLANSPVLTGQLARVSYEPFICTYLSLLFSGPCRLAFGYVHHFNVIFLLLFPQAVYSDRRLLKKKLVLKLY